MHYLGGARARTSDKIAPVNGVDELGASFYERESAALLRGADVAAKAAKSAVGAVVSGSGAGGNEVSVLPPPQVPAPANALTDVTPSAVGTGVGGDAPGTGNIHTITVVLPCAGEGNRMAQTARSIYEATPADVLKEIVGILVARRRVATGVKRESTYR